MSEIQITETELSYPDAAGQTMTVLDITDISKAINRIVDITSATIQDAPELLSVFNNAFAKLNKHLAHVRFQCNQAESLLTQRESEIILDESTKLLAEKNLKATDTLRKALIPLDSKYRALQENVFMLKSIVKLMEGQLKSLDMAYMSTKKLYPSSGADYSPKMNANAHSLETEEIGERGFTIGKVKYNY